MNWTFGICTDGQQDERLVRVIDAIVQQSWGVVDAMEILVIGNSQIHPDTFPARVRVIPFDEKQKPKPWITRKKNILCQEASFENVCLMHDYFQLAPNWLESFRHFGEDWDVCVPIVQTQNGRRLWCWQTFDHQKVMAWHDASENHKRLYVSGGFYCVKKSFALRNPLNEALMWGEAEDVEWSNRIRQFWNVKINPGTYARAMKHK